MKIIGLLWGVVLGVLALCISAFAHDAKLHEKMVPTDIQMKKLHAMMPMFSRESAGLESAINSRDITALKMHSDKILSAVPDLKKSKPHKNLKQTAEFKILADKLGVDVKTVVSFAEQGDFTEAQRTFKNLETRCAECHSKYRD